MSKESEAHWYAVKTAGLYRLNQKFGIDPALWFGLDDLKFRQRHVEPSIVKWMDRNSGVAQWRDKQNAYQRTESVWSYNNPFWPYLLKDHRNFQRKLDSTDDRSEKWAIEFANTHAVGGAFLVIKDGTHAETTAMLNTSQYKGPLCIWDVYGSSPVKPVDPTTAVTPVEELNSLGGSAISWILPNNPDANLSQFLGELREGLPSPALLSIYRDRTRNLMNNSGGEYLNYQFGIKPIVDDLRGFAKQIKRSEDTLRQYLKDSGKRVKRDFHFPPDTKTTTYDGVTFTTGSAVTGYAFLTGKTVVEESTSRWVDAAFVYHVPGGSSALSNMEEASAKADRLFGVDLTPELLWNLTPWSWMLDWFGNIGNIMTNISNLGHDGMVMQYGYIMERKLFKITHTATFQGQQVRTVRTFESKRRHPASPYGFGLTDADLSATQKAILVALGMSRA